MMLIGKMLFLSFKSEKRALDFLPWFSSDSTNEQTEFLRSKQPVQWRSVS